MMKPKKLNKPMMLIIRILAVAVGAIALFYLALHPNVHSVRFDVIALNIVAERTAHLRHLVAAYEFEE